MLSDYWLDQLVTMQGARTTAELASLLEDDRALLDALEPFDIADPILLPLDSGLGETIVAGSALDLSGALDCGHPDCITTRVDELFGRVWHYFDRVVVTGARRSGAFQLAQEKPDIIRQHLLRHAEVLFYLRRIGASEMLSFREGPHWCVHQLPEVADRLGLHQYDELRTRFLGSFDPLGSLRRDPTWTGDAWECLVKRPWGGVFVTRVRLPETASIREIAEVALEQEFHDIADSFAGDVLKANTYNAPLAVANSMHGNWLNGDAAIRAGNVALAIQLPYLTNVYPGDISYFRTSDAASFEAFRSALRTAIKERLAVGDDAAKSPEEIAQEIVQDVITPSLVQIGKDLDAARRIAAKKTAARVALTATAVTAGMLVGVPALVASGLGVIGGASALPPLDAYIDKTSEIEMRDMYFLWAAREHASS